MTLNTRGLEGEKEAEHSREVLLMDVGEDHSREHS